MSQSALERGSEGTGTPPTRLGFREALRFWIKLGFISFGGPAGQISVMHQELVERKRWISERRFLHALNYCMLLPGPEAQQLATYIGWLLHGLKGGLTAGSLFVFPSWFILVALSWIYVTFGNVPAVAGVLYGIKPAVTAIVVFAAYRIGRRALKNRVLWAVAGLAFVAIFFFKVPFPLIILGAGLIGYVGGRISPKHFQVGGGHGSETHSYGKAILDDDTPTPPHARFSRNRFVAYCSAGLALWLGTMGVLTVLSGWGGMLTQMGWFFTKAALLTFGGAYAVLPFVYQGAVGHYHWLTGPQMIDGLALGETTPGPLIMVVTFVGFVGGWTLQGVGSSWSFWAGAAGATVATFYTFLPSFVFILVGGPAVEATHGEIKFTSPLTGITSAVVGVVLNLGALFAHHVLWPKGFGGPFDWPSLGIGILAGVALIRYDVGIIRLIAVCSALGLAITFLG